MEEKVVRIRVPSGMRLEEAEEAIRIYLEKLEARRKKIREGAGLLGEAREEELRKLEEEAWTA